MKKLSIVLSMLLVLSLLLSACGKNNTDPITTREDLDGKMLATFGLAGSENDFVDMINNGLGITLKGAIIVPTPAEMALLVQNGQADAGTAPAYTAKYICAHNDDLDYIVGGPMAASMVFNKDSGLNLLFTANVSKNPNGMDAAIAIMNKRIVIFAPSNIGFNIESK